MSGRPYDDEAKAARAWWSMLQPKPGTGYAGDRAALARLRRCATILAAMSEPATLDLFRRMGFSRTNAGRDLPRAALLAAVLANVRDDTGKPRFAEAIGAPPGGKPADAKLKPSRFKRLIAAREPDDLLTAYRRAVALLDGRADVRDVARQLLAFTDPVEQRADLARTLFAFAYHGAAGSAPGAENNAPENRTSEA